MQRAPEMQEFVDGFSRDTFGISLSDAQAKLVCIDCRTNVTNTFRDALSVKEYGISGLCQNCQDRYFRAPEEDHDPDCNVYCLEDDDDDDLFSELF